MTDNAKSGIKGYLDTYGGEVEKYAVRIKSSLENTAGQTRNGVDNILNESTESQNRMSEELSQGYTDILGGASVFSLSFVDIIAGMLDITSGDFEEWTVKNKSLLGDFFDGINGNIANILSTIGTVLEDIGTSLTEWWDESGAYAFDGFMETLLDVGAVIMDIWNNYVSPFIDYLTESLGALWDEHLSPLWKEILEFITSVFDAVSAIWNNLLRPLYDTFIKRIMVGIMGAFDSVLDTIIDVLKVVSDVARGAVRIAKGVLKFIAGVFTGDLEKAFDGIDDMFTGTVIAMWGIFKGVINMMIDALNTVWSAVYGVIKSIVDGVGDFVAMIGDAFGEDWSFSLPNEVPRIPRLAEGTVIPANYGEFAAILGDNRREAEVVSPVSAIEQALENVMDRRGFSQSADGDIVIQIDGREVFRATRREAEHYKRMYGRPAFG